MQAAGIEAAANDRKVGKSPAMANELVRKLGFDFAFPDTRPGELEHAPESLFGEVAGLLDQVNFRVRFDRAKFMQHRRQPLKIVQGITPAGVGNETGLAGFHFD